MSTELPPLERARVVGRRDFLRLFFAVPAGLAAGAVLEPVSEFLGSEVTEHTGVPAGNAAFRDELDEHCPPSDSQTSEDCADEYVQDPQRSRRTEFAAPVIENLCYHTMPSLGMDMFSIKPDETTEEPPLNVVFGTGRLRLTRREMAVGAVSTLVFAGSHNVSSARRVHTESLPFQTLLGGAVLWTMQRWTGAPGSIATHVAYNTLWIKRRDYRRGWPSRTTPSRPIIL